MTATHDNGRRRFNTALAATGAAAALAPFGIARAQGKKLKVGVLLPRSGFEALIGQSCQKGVDLAPAVIKELLGVDIEIMSGDTESNVNTARTRAEQLIHDGAHVLVGAFDSGQTAAIAQVAEQRGVPLVVNIAAAPQITEQGYKFVFRNFPTAPELVKNGLSLIGDLFRATNVAPRSAVFMHVNDTFGQAMTGGIMKTLPHLTFLPFKITDTIGYDPAARDLSVEVSKAKAANADFLLLVCRLNDSIVLRREMVKQRWNPMGVIDPGSPGIYEEQFAKALGKYANFCIDNPPWYNPKTKLTKIVEAAFHKRNPKERFVYHGLNIGYTFEAILIAADAFKRAGSTDPKALADAIRTTDITDRVCLGGPIKFDAKGQVQGNLSACVQILDGIPRVVLPANAAEAKPVFPWPWYKA
ncbi:MAG: ABC transporter substrate-binding protein [Betaproteobacteria bacterium]|nr:ABC transporter substrate-binding protein [Betaproteobacteria bacterium]